MIKYTIKFLAVFDYTDTYFFMISYISELFMTFHVKLVENI